VALSLEQDGQELLDDTDSAASRGGGRFRVASILSQLRRRWWVISSPR